MADKPYPTDLTDQQWELIRPLLEHNHGQRGQQHYSLRQIVDGCFYVLRGGIPWRMMPHDLPPWGDMDTSPDRPNRPDIMATRLGSHEQSSGSPTRR